MNRQRVLDMSWWYVRKWQNGVFDEDAPDKNWYVVKRSEVDGKTEFEMLNKGAIPKATLTAVKAQGALSHGDIEAVISRGDSKPQSYDRHSPDGPPALSDDDVPF